MSVAARMVRYVNREAPNGCWEWIGGGDQKGYGIIRAGDARNGSRRAHRVSYELHRGPIPGGLTIDHLCRNRRCINPDHLEAVTSRVNTMRGNGIGVRNAAVTHCPYKHPYSEENTKIDSRGRRRCRTCMRAADRARRLAIQERAHGDN